jgi:RNA polymerase sigma factor (sigma-70 family)
MKQETVYKTIEDHYRRNFSELVKVYTPMLQGRANAEDAVQEAYTRALHFWSTLEYPQHINSWMDTILKRCASDKWKDVTRNGMVYEKEKDLRAAPSNPDSALQLAEVEEQIKKHEPHTQVILHYKFILGYNAAEIAKALGMKLNTVQQAIKRFRKELNNADISG